MCYDFKTTHYGAWNADHVTRTPVDVRKIFNNSNLVPLNDLILENGTLSLTTGKETSDTLRVRSVGYYKGSGVLVTPARLFVFAAIYYNADGTFNSKQEASYPLSRVFSFGKSDCTVRFIVGKGDGTIPITVEDVKPIYSLEFLQEEIKGFEPVKNTVDSYDEHFTYIDEQTLSSASFSRKNVIKAKVQAESSLSVLHTNGNMLYTAIAPPTRTDVTITKNSDGSIKVSGTTTSTLNITFVADNNRRLLKAGTYTLSGGKSNSAYMVLGVTGVGEKTDKTGAGNTFAVASDTTFYAKLIITNGTTIDDTFYPMLNVGSYAIPYVKPALETLSVSSSWLDVGLYEGVNNLFATSNFTLNSRRFVQEAGNIINLKDFAEGDGVTDDSDAINNALQLAAGGTLLVPAGTYLFSKTLNVPSNTEVKGVGVSSKFKLADSFNLSSYYWRTGNAATRKPMICIASGADACKLSNFMLEGQTSAFKD